GTPTPVSVWFFALNIAPAGEVNDRYGCGACSRLLENPIIWTPVWYFGCNNWRLCAVFLDGTSLKMVLRLMRGKGGGASRGGVELEVDLVDQGDGGMQGQGGLVEWSEVAKLAVGYQGGGKGNGRNQNGDAINDNIRGDVGNVLENNDRRGYTYKEFLACNPKEYDGKGGAIVYTR
ncbi:hypothetical protein Tco_1348725, partial [Tanacetum coccineum]